MRYLALLGLALAASCAHVPRCDDVGQVYPASQATGRLVSGTARPTAASGAVPSQQRGLRAILPSLTSSTPPLMVCSAS